MTEQEYCRRWYAYNEMKLTLYSKRSGHLREIRGDRVPWGYRGSETKSKSRGHVIHMLKHGKWPAKTESNS